jgi:hypothetical protein
LKLQELAGASRRLAASPFALLEVLKIVFLIALTFVRIANQNFETNVAI